MSIIYVFFHVMWFNIFVTYVARNGILFLASGSSLDRKLLIVIDIILILIMIACIMT